MSPDSLKRCLSVFLSGGVLAVLLLLTACQNIRGTKILHAKTDPSFEYAWQVLRDTYFDTNFHGLNWQGIHDELSPKAALTRSPDQLRPILEDMLSRLGRSHLAIIPAARHSEPELGARTSAEMLLNKPVGSGTLGLGLRLLDSNLVVTAVTPHSSAANIGIKTGWTLQSIDGVNLPQLLAELPSDHAFKKNSFLAWNLGEHAQRGDANSIANVTLLDGADQLQTLKVTRIALPGQPVALGHFPPLHTLFTNRWLDTAGPQRMGYIHFNFWMLPAGIAFDHAIEEMKSADGLVIDMRGNLGGLAAMVMGVGGHFVTNRQDLGVMLTRDNQLHLYANPRTVNPSGDSTQPYAGPLAILTDEISASAAELFAGGMQSMGRARIFGRPTAGQALPATFTKLPNQDLLYHAFADFILPNGLRLEAKGVIPDEWIPLRRSDLIDNRDAPLEAAVAWIKNRKSSAP